MLNVIAYTNYPYITADIATAIEQGITVTANGNPVTITTFDGENVLECHNPGMFAQISDTMVLSIDLIPGVDLAPGKTPHVTTTGDIEERIKLIEKMSEPFVGELEDEC